MKFYLRQLEPFTVSTHALYCHFLSGHFFHNLSLKQTRFENLRQIQRKKLFCDTVFSVISICATDWNYGEAVIKYFTFSFFYTSYWPSSRSVLQVTNRFCGTDWNHGEAVVKYFTFSFFYTYYWSSSRSDYKLRTDFYHVDVWPRAKCVGHTRSVHNYQRSLSRNKPNAVFFPYFR